MTKKESAARRAAKLDALARELGLTARQRALAEGFAAADPATPRHEIVKAAGYSGNRAALDVTASRALRNTKIAKYLKELGLTGSVATKRTRRAILTSRQVLRRLTEAAGSDIGAHLERSEDGGLVLNGVLAGTGFRLDPGRTRSVRGIEVQETTRQVGDEPVMERRIKLRVGADPAAVTALGLLAKHYKLIDGDEQGRERTVQVQVNMLLQQASPESLRQAVLSELARPR